MTLSVATVTAHHPNGSTFGNRQKYTTSDCTRALEVVDSYLQSHDTCMNVVVCQHVALSSLQGYLCNSGRDDPSARPSLVPTQVPSRIRRSNPPTEARRPGYHRQRTMRSLPAYLSTAGRPLTVPSQLPRPRRHRTDCQLWAATRTPPTRATPPRRLRGPSLRETASPDFLRQSSTPLRRPTDLSVASSETTPFTPLLFARFRVRLESPRAQTFLQKSVLIRIEWSE